MYYNGHGDTCGCSGDSIIMVYGDISNGSGDEHCDDHDGGGCPLVSLCSSIIKFSVVPKKTLK